MIFVKLTSFDDGSALWINLAGIELIVESKVYRGATSLFPLGADKGGYTVKETPQEIAELAVQAFVVSTGFRL